MERVSQRFEYFDEDTGEKKYQYRAYILYSVGDRVKVVIDDVYRCGTVKVIYGHSIPWEAYGVLLDGDTHAMRVSAAGIAKQADDGHHEKSGKIKHLEEF